MIDETLFEAEEKMESAVEHAKEEFAAIRTGRATPAMFSKIVVDYYGAPTPVTQMASVGVPEPRMLTVKPWDKTGVQAIEEAIRESDLGLNPQVDGDLIRIPIPALSEQRRKDLVKIAKKAGEECKVAVRKARHEALDMLNELKEGGDASEDEVDRAKKKAEEAVSEAGQSIDGIIAAKEKEILAI
jgi:ribosome recycling factor